MSVTGKIKVFSGNAHPALAAEICSELGIELGKASTAAVVMSNIAILIADYLIAVLLTS